MFLLASCLVLAYFPLKNPENKQEPSKKQARNKQETAPF